MVTKNNEHSKQKKGKGYVKARERRKEGLALVNQISEEREKYRNSFIN